MCVVAVLVFFFLCVCVLKKNMCVLMSCGWWVGWGRVWHVVLESLRGLCCLVGSCYVVDWCGWLCWGWGWVGVGCVCFFVFLSVGFSGVVVW